MNILRQISRRQLIIGGIIIIFLFGAFMTYRFFFTFHISSINPSLSSVSYQSPFIKLYFNKPISPKSLDFDDPNSLINKENIQVNDKELILYTNTVNFTVGSETDFTFSVQSVDGYNISKEKISFTPRDISFKDLPNDQQRVIKDLEQKKPSYYTDPILKVIPYSTLGYEIKPNFVNSSTSSTSSDSGALLIDIIVHLSNIDIREGRGAAIARNLSEAKNYLLSKGFNADNYSLNLIITEP